ncbi:hypothetical protein ACOSQ2_024216 [Xanthoceras sorbifolium]
MGTSEENNSGTEETKVVMDELARQAQKVELGLVSSISNEPILTHKKPNTRKWKRAAQKGSGQSALEGIPNPIQQILSARRNSKSRGRQGSQSPLNKSPACKSYDLIGLGGVIKNSDEGLVVAKQLGLPVALAEVDASSVVDGVNLLKPYLSVAGLVISDIQALCSEVGIQKCQVVARSSNSLAHNLASLAISSSRYFLWQDICLFVMLTLCG